MLAMVGAGPSGKSTNDWHAIWKNSPQAAGVQQELVRIKSEMEGKQISTEGGSQGEFAMPFYEQLIQVTIRVFQQYWRTPSYIYSKLLLGLMAALFIGFSFFHAGSSKQGIQNIIFAIFMIMTIFTSLVQQIMPRFVLQRDLYEVRERPSKAYSWKAFIIANIIVEIPYQILLGIMVYASFFYPIFTSEGIPSGARQGTILLLVVQFFVFTSTFAHMLISALPDAETAGNIATLMFSMTLTFNGVFQPPNALPGFWIFMYRVSPLTYLVSAIASTGVSGRQVICATNEISIMQPSSAGQTCGDYLSAYIKTAGGAVINPMATSDCEYCTLQNADQYLAAVSIHYSTRWRNYGIGFAYIVFNIAGAVVFYYLIRVRKSSGRTKALFEKGAGLFQKSKSQESPSQANKTEKNSSGESVPPKE